MTADRTRPEPPKRAAQEAALARLNPLAGRWSLELLVPRDPPVTVSGLWSTFEWMEGGLFLIWRWGPARPDFPGGLFPSQLSIIGYDDSTDQYFMHYFDSRGVYRILDMSAANGAWEMWRMSPGFSQRIALRSTDGGRAMTAVLERSADGQKWDHDFDMVFSRT
jgi:hypothetical protein